MSHALVNFQILRPQYETPQKQAIEWMAAAHTQAEETKSHLSEQQKQVLYQEFIDLFYHIGCKPEHIQTRGHELSDFLHQNWSEMQIFRLDQSSQGYGLGERLKFHIQKTDDIFEKYYPEEAQAPHHLIHVSCTGYSSPSSAQKLVSKRNWGNKTLITHAYHMGCYASIPAIRMATAFVFQKEETADIVHTELCSLHFNTSSHDADQIVLQSLFADGYIKYTVCNEEFARQQEAPYLQLLGLHEQIIPNSREAMIWDLTDWGFKGVLSKRIPALIARHVKEFIQTLAKKVDMNSDELLDQALFAVHPGGPKILDYIQEVLEARPEQLHFSRQILGKYGNISSATLPHIWQAICEDHSVHSQTPILSLAFGPGLNIAGSILIKK